MIYIVSGIFRSGTTAMMRAMDAGGLDVVKHADRRNLNHRHRDGNYLPNPDDLYEPNIREWSPSWPRKYEGKCIKLIAPIIRRIAAGEYSVAFMMRDCEEIRQSIEASFGLKHTVKEIEIIRGETLAILKNRRDVAQIVEINYTDLLDDPKKELSRLNWPIDVEKAAAVIDPAQYRFRLGDNLVIGL